MSANQTVFCYNGDLAFQNGPLSLYQSWSWLLLFMMKRRLNSKFDINPSLHLKLQFSILTIYCSNVHSDDFHPEGKVGEISGCRRLTTWVVFVIVLGIGRSLRAPHPISFDEPTYYLFRSRATYGRLHLNHPTPPCWMAELQ